MKHVFSGREKFILSAAIGVISFSFLLNIFILPLSKKNHDLNTQIHITRTKLIKYVRLLSQKDSIQEEYKSLPAGFALLNKQEGADTGALSELERLANGANMRIVDIRPSVRMGPDSRKWLSVDLRAEADMQGYIKFIYDIEHSLCLFSLKSVRIGSRPNTSLLEGNFSILQSGS